MEHLLRLFRQWDGSAFHRAERGEVVARVTSLVAEIRRLRALAVSAYPHVPESIVTRELVARLKAEVDRG